MLYLVATPIGNLEDITYRAIKILSSCDYILCEDTRKSLILLSHYKIKKPLFSFHKFNEKKEEKKILKDLENGKEIALISDAGTPIISDPGLNLVKLLIEKNFSFTAIPGPSSILQALLLSGFDFKNFQFCGFIPKKQNERQTFLKKIFCYEGVSICFETPHRILKSLLDIKNLSPKCKIAVAREMTKKFEECLRNSPGKLIDHFEKNIPKGEMVLLISNDKISFKDDLPLEDLIVILQKESDLSTKEAIKIASKLKRKSKKEIYKQIKIKI